MEVDSEGKLTEPPSFSFLLQGYGEIVETIVLNVPDAPTLGTMLLMCKGTSELCKKNMKQIKPRFLTQHVVVTERGKEEYTTLPPKLMWTSKGDKLVARKEGMYRKYYRKRNSSYVLVEEVNYENGKKNGTEKTWMDDGILWKEEGYKDDIPFGHYEEYDMNTGESLFSSYTGTYLKWDDYKPYDADPW